MVEGGGATSVGLGSLDLRLLGLVTLTEARQFIGLNIRWQDLHALTVVDGTVRCLQAFEVRLVKCGEINIHRSFVFS